ncbi:hypothetical protein [Novosphingobium kaempferiae]|nr:hypothetical protein [Novosphingobium kaempferiae]
MTEDENPNGSMWALYAGALALIAGGVALGLAWVLARLVDIP